MFTLSTSKYSSLKRSLAIIAALPLAILLFSLDIKAQQLSNSNNIQTILKQQKDTQTYQNVRDLYNIALKYSPNIQQNAASLDIAYASRKKARSVLYPTISVGYGLTRSDSKELANYNQNVLSLSASQYLYNAESFQRLEQTNVQVDNSQLALKSAHQQLILNIAQQWTNALLAKNNKELSELEVDSSKKILNKAKQSLDVGLGKKLDVIQAEAAYKLAIATQIQRQSNYIIALQNLSHLTGIKITALPIWNEQHFSLKNIPSYAKQLENNINIKRQLKALQNAELEIKAVQGQYYPQITFNLSKNQINYTETGSNSQPNSPISYTLQFSWELFSGFRTVSDKAKAHAMLKQQQAILKSTVLQQKAQLDNIIALLEADEQRIPAIQQQVEAAEIAYQALLQGYQLGTEDLPNVIKAQSDYQKAQISLTQNTYQYWMNYLNFKFIIGQLNPEDLP